MDVSNSFETLNDRVGFDGKTPELQNDPLVGSGLLAISRGRYLAMQKFPGIVRKRETRDWETVNEVCSIYLNVANVPIGGGG
jgi:hypothetical protein